MATAAKRTTTKTTEPKATETVEKATPQPQRKYEATELIPCRSITQGLLIAEGKQSKILYRWDGYGDTQEVEYRDLYAFKSSRSGYIYDPLFIIEDEQLLEDARWKEVKELYDKMYDSSDINEIINLPPAKFLEVLSQIPIGMKNAVKIEVATRLNNGSFDSIKKLDYVDKICGTELRKLV